MKIDVFNHIVTPRYREARLKLASPKMRLQDQERVMPALFDLDARFRAMDGAGDGYVQIINTANPPVELIAGPADALELSRIANDEMAELVARYPDRFVGAAACVPMNDIDAAIGELDRAIEQLGFRSVQLYTDIQGRPLDDPAVAPIFDRAAALDVPVLLHPVRGPNRPDYPSEDASQFDSWRVIGWLYDTVSAMTRLIFSGVFDRHPDIKIVTHHLGGFAPYASERIREGYDKWLKAAQARDEQVPVAEHPYDYFHRFYADTITIGSVPALRCGLDFFGTDRVMFATDMPFDTQGGRKYVEVALRAMREIDLPAADKAAIFEHNARRVFRLP
ncbi:MAG: amidohydrolase family protein [Acidobacteria bacterium]|nr:amidohydrolase family protein [Acidobacteriota bacterium]